ncbi:hypothetical protein [Pseudoalteromonas sp. S558]|jgi:hypothetical protein|uniref:hypothetical protein n=1 Tax=Pseudoalteromonas sp. S558 TaxID=2066515 RepID=UPI00110B608D|nr:hypothetical protein [Pseudoalteromonas sp. S558]TMN95630.1 hypothetical protein CWB66_18290 [Pseudoalteromonas sp. S558]
MSADEFIEHNLEDTLPEITVDRMEESKSLKKIDIDTFILNDITSLTNWILIIANGEGVCLKEPRVDLNIYGESDDSYLVINIYKTEESSNMYFFKTEDRRNPLSSLLKWLSFFNYDLRVLLELLDTSHYYETEMGPEIRHQGMIITKTFQEQNK